MCVCVAVYICCNLRFSSTYTLDKWQIRGVDVHASFTLCYLLLWVHLRLTNTARRQVTLCTASSSLTRSHLHIINPHMETLLHGHQRQQRPSLKIQSIVRLAASHIVLMMTTCPWKLSLSRLSYLMCLTLTCQTCRRLYPDDATNLEWEHFINNYTPVTTILSCRNMALSLCSFHTSFFLLLEFHLTRDT